MAKKVVKNSCNQPLYLNLLNGRTLKIRARSTTEVDEADLECPEMLFHRGRGNISVIEKAKPSRGSTRERGARAAEDSESDESS